MPAVLLEAGSIINRDEELAMGTPERRSLISAAAAAAVERFSRSQRFRGPGSLPSARADERQR